MLTEQWTTCILLMDCFGTNNLDSFLNLCLCIITIQLYSFKDSCWLGVMVNIYSSSTQDAESGEQLQGQGPPDLHREFLASWGHIVTLCLKTEQTKSERLHVALCLVLRVLASFILYFSLYVCFHSSPDYIKCV